MKTFKALCLKDQTIIDEDRELTLKRGKEYRISEAREDGTVTVFTSPYWADVPAEVFGGV